MKTSTKIEKTVILELPEAEALVLQDILQVAIENAGTDTVKIEGDKFHNEISQALARRK